MFLIEGSFQFRLCLLNFSGQVTNDPDLPPSISSLPFPLCSQRRLSNCQSLDMHSWLQPLSYPKIYCSRSPIKISKFWILMFWGCCYRSWFVLQELPNLLWKAKTLNEKKGIVKILIRLRQYIKKQETMHRHSQIIVKWPSEEEQKMEKLNLNRKSIKKYREVLNSQNGKTYINYRKSSFWIQTIQGICIHLDTCTYGQAPWEAQTSKRNMREHHTLMLLKLCSTVR